MGAPDLADFLTEEEQLIADEMAEDGGIDKAPEGDAPPVQEDGEKPAETAAPAEAPVDKPAQTPATTPATPAAPQTAAAADDIVDEDPKYPVMVADAPPADYDKKMEAFKAQKAELLTQFDNNEITAAEYSAKLDAINDERESLKQVKHDYDFATRQNEINADAAWNAVCERYASRFEELKGNAGRSAWNGALQPLLADPKNAGKPMTWFLRESHKAMRADLGMPALTAAENKESKKAAEAPRTRPAAPNSIRELPVATGVDVGGTNEFAALDRMEGIEQEQAAEALRRRDPGAYDRWLSGG